MALNVDDHLLEMAVRARHDASQLEAAAAVFQDVGAAHMAISRSHLPIKGMTISERVASLLEMIKALTARK